MMIIYHGRKKNQAAAQFLFPWISILALSLFWLPSVSVAIDCSTVTTISPAECQVLVTFYNSTGGPNWSDRDSNNWNRTDTPCDWIGITCEGGVTEISRNDKNLNGVIPDLSQLTNLQSLDLSSNQLSGTIPDLSNLNALWSLNLGNNQLTGSFPNWIGTMTNLETLILYNNDLCGNIPSSLTNLSNLSTLGITNNHLTATEPALIDFLDGKDAAWNNQTPCPTALLTVNKTGSGTGVVKATPGLGNGINCGMTCKESYSTQSTVTLTATADANSTFVGWTGMGCTDSFTITADMSCTATFELLPIPSPLPSIPSPPPSIILPKTLPLTIGFSGTGHGHVTTDPRGINCDNSQTQTPCSHSFNTATLVKLKAIASADSKFIRWGGNRSDCEDGEVFMTASTGCIAYFQLLAQQLTVSVTGQGTIIMDPPGLACDSNCSHEFKRGEEVTLMAIPGVDRQFKKWDGACTGTSRNIIVTMDQSKTCTATFITMLPQTDFFYNDDKVPLSVDRSQIGVAFKEGVDPESVILIARKSGITFTRKIVENVYIFKVPGVENRSSLVQKARQLKQQNSEEVDQVGLVVVPISLKDLPVREPTPMIISDEFIANFKPNTARDQIEVLNQRFAVEIVMENPFRKNQFLLRITENTPAISSLEIANSYNEQKNLVEYAHPNFVQVLEFRANQWPHNNDGTMVGSVADADMDTLEAKALVPAASSVVIAVIDDGFDMTHPDLATNYWSNPSELAGSAGSDDDGNGFIDDINGWNFTSCFSPSIPCGNNILNPGSGDKHGTAIVGVVAANGSYAAVTGSCPNCKVMPLRLSSSSTNYSQALAFDYAKNKNANIIVSSWGYIGGGVITAVVKNAIEGAAINNAVFFAMNDSNVSDCSSSTSSLTNVIAISSSTNSDTFANTGYGNCMDLLAPSGLGATTTDVQGNKGINTASTAGSVPPTCGILEESNQNYTNCFSGTSFSSALTAGVAGLILSVKPGLTRDQVQKLLQDTADKIDPVAADYDPNTGRSNSNKHGWGRINAFEAVRTVAPTEKNGVDIFLRDNDLDWGNTAQSSFPTPVQSRDIKIDALPYRVSGPPTTGIEFDSFISEPLNPGNVNKVYVRVHNRGTDTANTVTVKLYQAKAVPGGILPNLPATFWNASYMSYTNANPWYPLNCAAASPISPCIISNLQYSGSSVASTSNDTAQIVTFDFSVPANPEKFFLLAIVDSPQDPVASSTKTKFDVNDLTPRDNNVTYFSYNLLATIRSQTTGNWNNPATWSVWNGTTWQPGIRIPLNTDRVLVQNGHKVFVTSAKITIDSLYNQGQIWGQNGTNGSGTSAGEVQHATGGGNVWLTVENLLFNGNNGRIRAGRGGDGMYSWPPHIPTKGGTGGNIRIETNHDLINYGTIGPDAMQLSPRRSWKCLPNYPIPQLLPTGDVGGNGGTGHHWNENDNDRSGGNGGSTTVAGVNINNQGRIAAGHGGNAQEHDDCVGIPLLQAMPRTTPAEISAFEAALSNLTSIKAGLGGIATITPSGSFTGNGKIDGNGGSIWIEPTILINGREVHIYNSQNITIFGGDDATLALNDLRDEAIEATETITLAVGEGGIVDLRGNASKVLKAGASVKIFADTVLLNEGVTLQDLIDAPIIETYPHKILYHVTLHTPNQVSGNSGETLPVDIIVSNGGPTVDTYTLTVTDSASWQLGTLPNTITVEGLDSTELELNVTLPKVIEATDTITVTATSQQDPSISATVEIVVAVKDPTALPAPDDTLSNTDDIPSDTVDNQVPESDIFTSVEAALDWLEANNLSPEDLTKEQLDALPITWQDPTAVEPLTPPEPEPIPEPELTTTQLDEMEQVLVAINRKDVLEQAEVESLDKLSEDLLVIAQTIAQNYQDASQAALDQQRIDPLTNFEAQLKPLQDRITTIAILAQNAMERVQIGEMFLSPELVNNLSDEELASFLGNQGLKAHTTAGIISTERSQAISKLGIPALNLDILDFSNSCLSTPISSLDSVLDLFFPKAEAAAVLSCVAICASKGFGSACVNCIVSKGINVTNKLKALINEWKRCKKERWWKRWWCRTKVIAKIIYYVG